MVGFEKLEHVSVSDFPPGLTKYVHQGSFPAFIGKHKTALFGFGALLRWKRMIKRTLLNMDQDMESPPRNPKRGQEEA